DGCVAGAGAGDKEPVVAVEFDAGRRLSGSASHEDAPGAGTKVTLVDSAFRDRADVEGCAAADLDPFGPESNRQLDDLRKRFGVFLAGRRRAAWDDGGAARRAPA